MGKITTISVDKKTLNELDQLACKVSFLLGKRVGKGRIIRVMTRLLMSMDDKSLRELMERLI